MCKQNDFKSHTSVAKFGWLIEREDSTMTYCRGQKLFSAALKAQSLRYREPCHLVFCGCSSAFAGFGYFMNCTF